MSEAVIVHDAGLAAAAGRTAYFAGFHAAQGLIYERTRRVAKTHAGLHSEYARLTRELPSLGEDHRRFLGRGYIVKVDADYGTDLDESIDLGRAEAMISQAVSFLSWNEDAAAKIAD